VDVLSFFSKLNETAEDAHLLMKKLNEKLLQTEQWRRVLIQHMKGVDLEEVTKLVTDALLELIPVRSGRLLDTILNTIKIERTFYDVDNIFFDLTYTHASKRPDPIWGRAKHGVQIKGVREFGLGEDYIPTHSIKNVKRITTAPSATTNLKTYGNPDNVVLYELDDPLARTEIFETVTKIYVAAFVNIFDELLESLPIKFADITIGKISGVITSDVAMQKYLKSRLD